MMPTRNQMIATLFALISIALVFFLFSFFFFHKGLPTGDSQKSIIWAQQILQTRRLPNYQTSISLLNRDPVDFYTPALHILTAAFLRLGGLPAVGISAIIFAILTALAAAAIAYHVLPEPDKHLGTILTVILVLTQERFLRYVREPGYHYQNIVGELLLFSLLLLGLHLLERWRWSVFVGMIITAALLTITHQFSAFLSFFTALPLVAALAFRYRRVAIILLPFLAAFFIVAIPLDLHQKIPHIFTSFPHLLPQTPNFLRMLDLMGGAWMILGIAGALLLTKQAHNNFSRIAFLSSAFVLLLLSQGPRLSIDIPPVRALLYLVIPLSITGAYFLVRLGREGRLAFAAVIALTLLITTTSVTRAFTLSHTIRTNSTLTPGQLELINYLSQQMGSLPRGEQSELYGVLIDDYNRRSSSWLVLSGHPMFTRIAADLETQMKESQQSKLRYELYLNQLDYEKIYSLGSLPEITQLMEKQNITWLVGIDSSSVSHFEHNPALQEVKKIDDITLFRLQNTPEVSRSDSSGVAVRGAWLLKPSTLANDIGDLEDTFEHLPASLRATRLSEPQVTGNTTFRSTTAPLIPLKFNVGDYVQVLWDQDNDQKPDTSLELFLKFTDREETRKISPGEALIDDEGFITLTINNSVQQPLKIDLIALGLAHTP